MKPLQHSRLLAIFALMLAFLPTSRVSAGTAGEINREARGALQQLYSANPAARRAGKQARAVLVFPRIVKAGFIVGGQHGDGALISGSRTLGYYRTDAASYGLQAGVQTFGYALFFMNDGSLAYLRKSDGWEIGTGPSVVIVDEGMAKNFSSTTLQKGVYAFTFDQRGLMAGLGLQGSKITPIHPR